MNDARDSSGGLASAQAGGGRRLLEAIVNHLAVLAVVTASVAAVAMRPAAPLQPVAAASEPGAQTAAGAKPACRSCLSSTGWHRRPTAHRG